MIKANFRLDLSKTKLKELGFRYDNKADCYVYRFPVYNYKKQPVIFCKIWATNEEDHNIIMYGVFEANDTLYAGYYNEEYGYNTTIKQIDKTILHKLKALGAKRVD